MADSVVEQRVVITDLTYKANLASLAKQAHVREDSSMWDEFVALVGEAESVARPKGVYRTAYIERHDGDGVVIDGIELTSRVLAVNLKDVHRVFMFVATCGTELDAWAHALDDVLYDYWAESIKLTALRVATHAVFSHIDSSYVLGKTAQMNPGSLQDWPLREQHPFFQLMGDVEGDIGVTLSESSLMSPNKSVSGLRFPTEGSFESCMLCPREGCPGRRATYDAEMYAKRYKAVS